MLILSINVLSINKSVKKFKLIVILMLKYIKFNAILYYEIPKDAQKITIEYDDNAWSNTKVIFNVK